LNIPSVSATFDRAFFNDNPAPFYSIVKELFLPIQDAKIKPGNFHTFISLLHKKGLLLRNFTQKY